MIRLIAFASPRLALRAGLAAFATFAVLAAAPALAATTGVLTGRIVDEDTGNPMAGVTIVAAGPQGELTEFTDSNGRYQLTDLEPGEYNVTAFFGTSKVELKGVQIQIDKSLVLNLKMPKARTQEIHIKEKAPNVDVANTNVQTQVTDELVKNTPVGRTYAAVLSLAPGSATDGVGFSFNGATGPENTFLVDGLNTTNPAFGLIGTPLTLEFVKETEIITGGYGAEYGRATGGVVSVVTKSGSNEFHGGLWFFGTPFQTDPNRLQRPGESVVTQRRLNGQQYDFGFDIGGPIIKNRLFFYAGFAPNFITYDYTRILRSRLDDHYDPNVIGPGSTADTYAGDPDSSITCPAWTAAANPALCQPSKAAAFATKDLDEKFWGKYQSVSRLYNAIAKLSLRINDNNSLTFTYIGSPSTFDGVNGNPRDPASIGVGFTGRPDTMQWKENTQVHDATVHLMSKLLDRRLQLDVQVGFHYESYDAEPQGDANSLAAIADVRPRSIADFETSVEPCRTKVLDGKDPGTFATFNPCPATGYRDGGFGFYRQISNYRATATAAATYFLKLAGTHALKLGGDFEYNVYDSHRGYTGGANGGVYTFFDQVGDDRTGSGAQRVQFGSVQDDGTVKLLSQDIGGFHAYTTTLNYSAYLRDSWNLGFLPGMTVNLGLRWEAQQVKDINGNTAIGLWDNIAPRIGVAYDFTGKGKSKLYASWGWFYESIPLDINDRQFSKEGLVIQTTNKPCDPIAPNETPVLSEGDVIVGGLKCHFDKPSKIDINGGEFGKVSPVLKGQYSQEVVAGLQYDVGADIVLGAAYIHRDLGRIVEDVSPDGGHTYIIANPGEAPDPGAITDLQKKIDSKNVEVNGASGDARTKLEKERDDLSTTLSLYKAAANFEKPKRDYNALVLTAQKRFSHNFILLASYTYSRTIGNYPGLFQASNGQLDPNISTQYDLVELLINRNGPLPNDRPHNVKLTGAYNIPMGVAGSLNLGVNFSALSGTPIEVLGRHPTYGANETFILPRGSGGRTPMLTSLDARIAWAKQMGKLFRAEISLDVFNVLNLQGVTAVDMAYTSSSVLPLRNGTYDDLKNLKSIDGSAPLLNPNYGQPVAYQQPLSLRLGARITF